jgi:hypothetical protein
MKTTHQLLSEIITHPDAKDVLANALCNMLDHVAFGDVLDEDDIKDFLQNATP